MHTLKLDVHYINQSSYFTLCPLIIFDQYFPIVVLETHTISTDAQIQRTDSVVHAKYTGAVHIHAYAI